MTSSFTDISEIEMARSEQTFLNMYTHFIHITSLPELGPQEGLEYN